MFTMEGRLLDLNRLSIHCIPVTLQEAYILVEASQKNLSSRTHLGHSSSYNIQNMLTTPNKMLDHLPFIIILMFDRDQFDILRMVQ